MATEAGSRHPSRTLAVMLLLFGVAVAVGVTTLIFIAAGA